MGTVGVDSKAERTRGTTVAEPPPKRRLMSGGTL